MSDANKQTEPATTDGISSQAPPGGPSCEPTQSGSGDYWCMYYANPKNPEELTICNFNEDNITFEEFQSAMTEARVELDSRLPGSIAWEESLFQPAGSGESVWDTMHRYPKQSS